LKQVLRIKVNAPVNRVGVAEQSRRDDRSGLEPSYLRAEPALSLATIIPAGMDAASDGRSNWC
jgi:hypothetical protein